VSAYDAERSRRWIFPPLWLIPILFIGTVLAVYYSSLGGLGLLVIVYLLACVQPRLDAYIRGRELSDD
jgi:hypothetical protein